MKKITKKSLELEADRGKSNLATVFSDVHKKQLAEDKAWEVLFENLDSDKPNLKYVEMILKPKFPVATLNINAELEGASVEDILKMIDEM